VTQTQIETYWEQFLAAHPEHHGKSYIAEPFGDNPALADELGNLVLSGVKSATCSAVWEYEAEGEPIPQIGTLWLVLDGRNEPMCVVETIEVTLCKYNEVDADFARAEGEDDLTLESWRAGHKRFFTRTLAPINKDFSEDMPLVCERFHVIYK
jgi:uncharacterized protein YhfF